MKLIKSIESDPIEMNNLRQTKFSKVLQCGLFIAVLFGVVACDAKKPGDMGYVPTVKVVELDEVGQCKDEKGTLAEINYVGFNLMSFWSDFMYFIQPPMGEFCIPNLDESKRQQLSESEKLKLEVGYFNSQSLMTTVEPVKDLNGKISYQPVGLRQMQELVGMGSELAYIDLHLFDYKHTRQPFKFLETNPYYQRLKRLAKSGNAEAMCLYSKRTPTPFIGYEHLEYNKQQDSKDKNYFKNLVLKRYEQGPEDKWEKGMIQAAKAGGSYCMWRYGQWLLSGNVYNKEFPYIEKNVTEGMKYYLKAAEIGNADVAMTLSLKYILGPASRVPPSFDFDLGKYQCWSQIYNQSFPPVYKPIRFKQEIKQIMQVKKITSFTEYSPSSLCQTINESMGSDSIDFRF